jgi:hypothetical protein
MWTRQALLISKDISDRQIWKYISAARDQSLYGYYLDKLMLFPGFVRKELNYIENQDGITMTSRLVFEDKETLDRYLADEDTTAMWMYIKVVAAQMGLDLQISDIKITPADQQCQDLI